MIFDTPAISFPEHSGGIRVPWRVHIILSSEKKPMGPWDIFIPLFQTLPQFIYFIFSIFVFFYIFLMFEMRENPIAKGYLSGTHVQNIKWRVPWSTVPWRVLLFFVTLFVTR